jgi:predicted transcriptional regulator
LVYEKICSQPGLSYQELRAELRISAGALNQVLRRLKQEELVQSRRLRLKLRFYPKPPASPASPLVPLSQNLVRLLQQCEGLSQSEAARHLGATRQALHYHVNELRMAGIVGWERKGRKGVLSILAAGAARLGHCPNCTGIFVLAATAPDVVACPYCPETAH